MSSKVRHAVIDGLISSEDAMVATACLTLRLHKNKGGMTLAEIIRVAGGLEK